MGGGNATDGGRYCEPAGGIGVMGMPPGGLMPGGRLGIGAVGLRIGGAGARFGPPIGTDGMIGP